MNRIFGFVCVAVAMFLSLAICLNASAAATTQPAARFQIRLVAKPGDAESTEVLPAPPPENSLRLEED